MKRIFSTAVLLSFMITLSACSLSSEGVNNTGSDETTSAAEEIIFTGYDKTEGENNKTDNKESVIDKDTDPLYTETFDPGDAEELVYVVPKYFTAQAGAIKCLNLYLQKQGKPYYITLKAIDEDISGKDYPKELAEMIDSGEKVDLLFSGIRNKVNGYDYLAENGYLYDLSSYLSSDEGSNFYRSIPEHYWKNAEREGIIFGASGYTYSCNPCPGYIINKKLMEKYGYTEENFKCSIEELTDIFKTVQQGEGEKFYPFTATISPSYSISSFYSACDGVSIDRSTNTAVSITENEDYMSFIKAIYEMEELGFYHSNESKSIDDFLLKFDFGIPLPDYLIYDGTYTVGERTATSDDVVIIPLEQYGSYQVAETSFTCISSKSEHTDNALDFLEMIFTDRIVTDYLIFGVKGIDYYLEDGKISYESMHPSENTTYTAELPRMIVYGNSFICTPRYYESDDMNTVYYNMQNNLLEDPLNKFQYEVENSGIEAALGYIPNSIGKKSFDEMKTALEESLQKSGIDKLLESVNKKLEEYLGS